MISYRIVEAEESDAKVADPIVLETLVETRKLQRKNGAEIAKKLGQNLTDPALDPYGRRTVSEDRCLKLAEEIKRSIG
eukprot:Skav213112  [mRNA]  locus=scaffold107:25230:26230:+ [translate_table: standard]